MNKQSLVGLKFGKLTVLSQDISNSKGSLAWVCKCDCGNQTIVINNKLKNGYTQSCGCLHKEKFHNKKINPTDLVGIKCGYFTISKYLGQINLGFKSGQQRYEHEYYCVCKCGKEKIIRRNSLLNKKIASCGCIQKDNYYEKLLTNIGKKFGRLLVINVIKDECKLLCKCECGKEIKTKINPLKNNKKSSCGCLLKESQISNAKKATKSNTLNGIDYILNYNYSIYNHSAKKRNISFELSHEFFNKIIMKNCYYCNSIPSREISSKLKKHSINRQTILVNGIDRINSELGYVENNVLPCCTICNNAKKTMDYNNFITWLNRVAEFRKREVNNPALKGRGL